MGAEIRNAIQAGKEVTFHEARIHEHGWSGYGYSIVDPETGAGAYLIEGKGNGGWFLLVALAAVALFLLFGIIGSLALGGLIASIALPPFYTLAIGALALLSSLLADNNGGFDYDCGGISTCDSSDYIVIILAAASSIALIASGSILGVLVGILLFASFIKGKYFPNP